jgi:hypothetical protein
MDRFAAGASAARSRTLLRRRLTALAVAGLMAVSAALLVGTVLPRLAQAAPTPVSRGVDGASLRPAPALAEHVVAPGDTVWALAEQVSAADDPRKTVDRIMTLNNLQSPALRVGQTLLLPRS